MKRISADEMIGKAVCFDGIVIGVIDRAKFGPTIQWGDAWTFRLDNGHWIGDVREACKWSIVCPKEIVNND